jgi:uncharacterized membrane protein YdjX (TVP38/TMEM64 family)
LEKQRSRAWIIVVLSFGFAVAAVLYIARNQELVEDLIRRLGAFGPLASLVLYALLGLSPVPADPLSLIIGAVFGPLWGGMLAWTGMTLAALLEYYMGTRIASAAEFEQRKSELPWGLDELPVDSIWFLIGGRMLTGAGSKIVSFASGIYRVPIARYLWTTAVSMLIGAVLFSLGGFGLVNIF